MRLKAKSEKGREKLIEICSSIPRKSELDWEGLPESGVVPLRAENGAGKTTLMYQILSDAIDKGVAVSSYFSGQPVPSDLKVSKGQEQRHLVREATSKDADLYLFDEPCSHTDDEEWFVGILSDLEFRGKTVVFTQARKDDK